MTIKESKLKAGIEKSLLFLLFFAVFGFMPTSRPGDNYVWAAVVLMMAAYSVFSQNRMKETGGLTWFVLMALYGGLSCLWAEHTDRYVNYLTNTATVVVVSVLCVSGMIRSENDVHRFFRIVIAAGCAAALRYCYYTDLSGILSTGIYIRGTFGGLIDDVTNYNNYTTPLCLVTVISCYYSFFRQEKLSYISTAFLSAVLLFSGSRKTVVVVAAVSLFFTLKQGSVKKKIRAILLLIALLVAVVLILEYVPFMASIREKMRAMVLSLVISDESLMDNSTYLRYRMKQEAIRVWKDNLFLGVGWNNFRYRNSIMEATAHNNWLELLASLGTVGFVLYYSYYGMHILNYVADYRRRKDNPWQTLMVGYILAVVCLEYGSTFVYDRTSVILTLCVLSCLDILRKNYRVLKLQF